MAKPEDLFKKRFDENRTAVEAHVLENWHRDMTLLQVIEMCKGIESITANTCAIVCEDFAKESVPPYKNAHRGSAARIKKTFKLPR